MTTFLVGVDRSIEPASYTIELPGGVERQTERSRLHVLRSHLPPASTAATSPGRYTTDPKIHAADEASRLRFERQHQLDPSTSSVSWLLTLLLAGAL